MSTTVAELAAQVAHAHVSAEPLRVVGGGTWLQAGRPCSGGALPVGECTGIVEYTPGDLTLTARAGTTLEAIAEATAEHGQWLPLDPESVTGATLGATIATASDGPLAFAMGRVRDLVLGVECITGTGELIRAGGRVVKNVAGFDLVRLHTGAWGTLGVITEATVRLRARPEVDRAFVVTGDERVSLESRLAPLADLPIAPLALELLSGAMANALGVHDRMCLLVRLAGNETRVSAQMAALDALGDVHEVPVSVFNTLSELSIPGAMVARVSHMPTHFSTTWRHVMDHLSASQCWQPLMRGSVARGVVRVAASFEDETPVLERFVRGMVPPGAAVTWEMLPADAWQYVPSAVSDRVSMGLRRALDPAWILNRGLLGESMSTAPA
jgi:glycolate oxidase FAD binding subunit